MSSSYLQNLYPSITLEQLEKLNKYYELLATWSKVMNLTTIIDQEEVYIKHFYDSMLLLNTTDFANHTLCDIGSGAGFPGLVIAIMEPSCEITLLEPLQKRVRFLNVVIEELKLNNVKVFAQRAEDFVTSARQSFDIVTARAVAQLPILLELALPLLKVNGYMLAMKSQQASFELDSSLHALQELNAKVWKQFEFTLPNDFGQRVIIKMQKVDETPKKYPRAYAQIKKKPL